MPCVSLLPYGGLMRPSGQSWSSGTTHSKWGDGIETAFGIGLEALFL
jgi:hypothetical protein